MSLREIMVELQSRGALFNDNIHGRRYGAGPAEGRTIIVGSRSLSVPAGAPYVSGSPFKIGAERNGYYLYHKGIQTLQIEIPREPRFYRLQTEEGVPYRHLALLHGRDCLASTVIQECYYQETGDGCSFCGIHTSLKRGLTLGRKPSDLLAEISSKAKELDGVTHVTLTSGSDRKGDSSLKYLLGCASRIFIKTGLPVHVQFRPPEDMGLIDGMADMGVKTAGIHIESFDGKVLKRHCPSKYRQGKGAYTRAWRRAVKTLGPNQVSSFIIAGLGEDPRSIFEGARTLADMGVFPYVVPLRPIDGTPLGRKLPPDPRIMIEIYHKVSEILREYGLSSKRSKAGCVRCGSCSVLGEYEIPPNPPFPKGGKTTTLTPPSKGGKRGDCEEGGLKGGYEVYSTKEDVVIRRMRTTLELEEAIRIRNEVFLHEQGMIKSPDPDENDSEALHLIALVGNKIVGTVRMYPNGGDTWIGGRLAVSREYRGGVGSKLVEAAVREVRGIGCGRFIAYIQAENEGFFSKLGWLKLSDVIYMEKKHLLMEAPL